MFDCETFFVDVNEKLKLGDFLGVSDSLNALRKMESLTLDTGSAITRYLEVLFEHLCNDYATIEYCMNNYLSRLVDLCFSLLLEKWR